MWILFARARTFSVRKLNCVLFLSAGPKLFFFGLSPLLLPCLPRSQILKNTSHILKKLEFLYDKITKKHAHTHSRGVQIIKDGERTRYEARLVASERRIGQACVRSFFVLSFVLLFLLLTFFFLTLLQTTNKRTDIQGLRKKKRELSDKIRQDALDIERLEKRVEVNKKKQKQVENLIDQGVQAKRKILETSKHVVMHLKRESEAFLHANGTEDGNEDSYSNATANCATTTLRRYSLFYRYHLD